MIPKRALEKWLFSFIILLTLIVLHLQYIGAITVTANEKTDYATFVWVGGHGTNLGFYNSIKAVDIDNDRNIEIIFGNAEGYVHIIEYDHANKTFIDEWRSPQLGAEVYGLVVANIDEDKVIELICGNRDGFVYVFDATTYTLEWKSEDLGSSVFGLDVADVDSDRINEIIVSTGEGFIYVFDAVTYVQEWKSESFDDYNLFGLTVADIDYDGVMEIVTTSGRGYIYVINGKTHEREWSNRETNPLDRAIYTVKIANTDNQGGLDLIVATCDMMAAYDGISKIKFLDSHAVPTGAPYGIAIGGTGGTAGGKKIFIGAETGEVHAFCGVQGHHLGNSEKLGTKLWGLELIDIDFDNGLELVVGSGEGNLFILNSANFDVEATYEAFGKNTFGVAVGDVNNDDVAEIVIGDANGRVQILDLNYQLKWSSEDLGTDTFGIAIGDPDNDKKPEFLVGTREGIIYMFRSRPFAEVWHSTKLGNNVFTIVITDANRDQMNEIIAGTSDGKVHVIHLERGKYQVNLWNVTLNSEIVGICVANVDHDNGLELVVATSDADDKCIFYVIDGKTYATKWQSPQLDDKITAVTIADSDANGKNNILIASATGYIYVFEFDMETYREADIYDFEELVVYQLDSERQINAMITDDIDLDSDIEIVISTNDGYIYSLTGKSGEIEWQSEALTPALGRYGSLALIPPSESMEMKRIVVGSSGYLYVIGFNISKKLPQVEGMISYSRIMYVTIAIVVIILIAMIIRFTMLRAREELKLKRLKKEKLLPKKRKVVRKKLKRVEREKKMNEI